MTLACAGWRDEGALLPTDPRVLSGEHDASSRDDDSNDDGEQRAYQRAPHTPSRDPHVFKLPHVLGV